MATYSTSLKLTLLADGEQSGVWGQTQNTNLGTLLEQAITGVVTIDMANANYTLSNLNGASDEARNAVIIAGGANSAQRDVIAPLVEKVYTIVNATTGGYSIRIRGSSGDAVIIPYGATMLVYCDGINFYNGVSYINGSATSVSTANYTMTQSGANLVFSYDGTPVFTLGSTGNVAVGGAMAVTGNVSTSANIVATGNVTAATVIAGS
jgi:hypothetical protein